MHLLFEVFLLLLAFVTIVRCYQATRLPYDRRRNSKLAFTIGIFSSVILLIAQILFFADIFITKNVTIVEQSDFELLGAVYKSVSMLAFILFAESVLPSKSNKKIT